MVFGSSLPFAEPLETDFPRDYKTVEEDIANEDVDDALEDDPLRLDNDAEFTPVDTSDYSQVRKDDKCVCIFFFFFLISFKRSEITA